MQTVAEIMAGEESAREPAIARLLDEVFPSAMIDRAIGEVLACKGGGVGAIEEALKLIVPRLYGYLQQADASMAGVSPLRLEVFTWTLVKVFLVKVDGRIPPSGGGRRVAA